MLSTYGGDDVGTRIEHLMQLQDIWSFALGIVTAGSYHTDREREQAKELETALKYLMLHIQSNYVDTPYARVINELPKDAKEIL
jgi:hypothetical protein